MSGLTLAAGTREASHGVQEGKSKEEGPMLGGIMGSLRVVELQLVAFIVVFSASGLVPLLDMAFPVFATAYFFFLSSFVFKSYQRPDAAKEVFHGSRMFQLYVVLGTIVGLFLPLAYVLGGFARGDQPAVRAAAPHLFLLSAQILSENIVSSMKVWSPPVRALIPIFYTGRRLLSLTEWVTITFFRANLPPEPWIHDVAWLWFGRVLSLANFTYFSINFLVFLIPRFLPRAFDRYYKQRDEAMASKGDSSDISAQPPKEKKAQ